MEKIIAKTRELAEKRALIAKELAEKRALLAKSPLNKVAHWALNHEGGLYPDESPRHAPLSGYLYTYRTTSGFEKRQGWKQLCALAEALDRQLTVDDLKLIFVDEGEKRCLVTGEVFRSISWVDLSPRSMQDILYRIGRGGSFESVMKKADKKGPFYPRENGLVVAVSGAPFDQESPLCQIRKDCGEGSDQQSAGEEAGRLVEKSANFTSIGDKMPNVTTPSSKEVSKYNSRKRRIC